MKQHIRTERLVLRPLTQADGDAVVSILNDLDVSRWLVPIPHPFTHADLRITAEDGGSRWPDLAAVERDGDLIGGIAMGTRLGYYLAPDHWGQGLAGEAAKAAVDFSFRELSVASIEAGYFEGNLASSRILSNLGFQVTGRGPQNCAALSAARASVDVSLTRQDWQANA